MPDAFEKYARQMSIDEFGEPGQARLNAAHVVLIGAGGVGAAVLPLIAGAGVGRISIVDFDIVSESNLHRQTIYAAENIGESKALLAAAYAQKLNPSVKIEPHEIRLEVSAQLIPLLEGADICIDATDSFHARFIISDACEAAKKNLISASAERWTSQLVCLGEGFHMRSLVADESASSEKSQCPPIFGPSASLSGVLAAGLALRVLAGLESFKPGTFLRYSFDGNNFLSAQI